MSTPRLPDPAGSEVLFVRIPSELKSRLEDHARDTGGRSVAVVARELLQSGLHELNQAAVIRQQADVLTQLREALALSESAKMAAEAQAAGLRAAVDGLGQRLSRPLGTCGAEGCAAKVTGSDLLVTGCCPSCGRLLVPQLQPAGTVRNFNNNEALLLVGAVGILLGIALLSGRPGVL